MITCCVVCSCVCLLSIDGSSVCGCVMRCSCIWPFVCVLVSMSVLVCLHVSVFV